MFYISEEEFNNLKPLDGDDEGRYATCYKYKDGVLKVYKTFKYYKLGKDSFIKKLKSLKKIKVNGISFPMDIGVTYDNKLAYTMPFLDGVNFSEIKQNIENNNYDITLEQILYCYQDAIEKLEKLNSLNFKIVDLHQDNCKLLKDNKFGLLDIDFYEKVNKKYHDNICKHNIKQINELFSDFLNKFYILMFLHDEENYLMFTDNIEYKNYIDEIIRIMKDKTKTNSLRKMSVLCREKWH